MIFEFDRKVESIKLELVEKFNEELFLAQKTERKFTERLGRLEEERKNLWALVERLRGRCKEVAEFVPTAGPVPTDAAATTTTHALLESLGDGRSLLAGGVSWPAESPGRGRCKEVAEFGGGGGGGCGGGGAGEDGILVGVDGEDAGPLAARCASSGPVLSGTTTRLAAGSAACTVGDHTVDPPDAVPTDAAATTTTHALLESLRSERSVSTRPPHLPNLPSGASPPDPPIFPTYRSGVTLTERSVSHLPSGEVGARPGALPISVAELDFLCSPGSSSCTPCAVGSAASLEGSFASSAGKAASHFSFPADELDARIRKTVMEKDDVIENLQEQLLQRDREIARILKLVTGE